MGRVRGYALSKRVVFQTKFIKKEPMVLYEGWSSHTPVGDKEEC